MFVPKLFSVFKTGYTRKQLYADGMAGIIVGIVALPLAIAFAIASGVPPEKGIYTAIIAGFIISLLGGSRVQIGGPTGAFIVIVYGIVAEYGIEGLTIATFMAGFIILILGLIKLGVVIKFIPHSLVVGFTSGIALIIFSSQIKDFMGLSMGAVPADFIAKWQDYFIHIDTVNYYAFGIAIATVLIATLFSKVTGKIPGSLIAILVATVAVYYLKLDVETIGSRFGEIPTGLPKPSIPIIEWETIKKLIQPAFTIALLGAIESLLSAVVADGMIGGNHRSNMELVAQGTANIFSAIFGGIPATGAIARTATNIKNGGRTPISGIIHAVVLLIILLFAGKWAKLIPLPCLAGILVVVAYNMSEWRSFVTILRGPVNDTIIMISVFLLTVFIDLTIAIEIGMVLAAFLFMRRMALISDIKPITNQMNDQIDESGLSLNEDINKEIQVYEVNGPLFFGAAHHFREIMLQMNTKPKVLVIRMRNVPVIDETGLYNLKEFIKKNKNNDVKIILSGVQKDILTELNKARISFMVGKKNILSNYEDALKRAKELTT
jgi:sulfate permease, SulP family